MTASCQSNGAWTDILCCTICSRIFDPNQRLPYTLTCSHIICAQCATNLKCCPVDNLPLHGEIEKTLPVNTFILSVICPQLSAKHVQLPHAIALHQHDLPICRNILQSIQQLAHYFTRATAETGGSVYSSVLSRPMQRKLLSLTCCQFVDEEGRIKALKHSRAVGERVVSELLVSHHNHYHLSSRLWSAVRTRGCQFLGPAMQEEVLKLIMLALSEGASIARKTLVLYIVQTLSKEYPQTSKTSVGHVVQLLYRASCFNVFKREGESSLMQLKEQYRVYEELRREHDSQIVQMANEAGLRISPDQWSSLLYGDLTHRSHMQSIIDKLVSQETIALSIQELRTTLNNCGDTVVISEMVSLLETLNEVTDTVDDATMETCAKYVQCAIGAVRILVNHNQSCRRKQACVPNAIVKPTYVRPPPAMGLPPYVSFAPSNGHNVRVPIAYGPPSNAQYVMRPPPPPGHMLQYQHIPGPPPNVLVTQFLPSQGVQLAAPPNPSAINVVNPVMHGVCGQPSPLTMMPPPVLVPIPSQVCPEPEVENQEMWYVAKREEILRRLGQIRKSSREEDDERSSSAELSGHVSWACAISVLDVEEQQMNQQPPVNTMRPSAVRTVVYMKQSPSPTAQQTHHKEYMSPHIPPQSVPVTMVALPYAGVHVSRVLTHPVATPTQLPPNVREPLVTYAAVDAHQIMDIGPEAMKVHETQETVGSSINRIVQVQSRLNDHYQHHHIRASNVEKQHLHMELKMMHQQLDSLDRSTQAACLIRELHSVNSSIDQMKLN